MNKYAIPNLVKACEILHLLSEQSDGLSAAEIETRAQVPRTTAFRILKTLCSEGMAEKRDGLFFAGPGLVQLGLNSLRSQEIRTLAIPFLSELANTTDFTAHLAVPTGRRSLILEVHDSPHPVRVASRSGTTVPLYCSSTGKVFLAFRYADELEDYFAQTTMEKYTDQTITTLQQMHQEVETIRQNGYAVDNHEFHADVWCLAAPVRDSHGTVTAAIGVTGPAAQSNEQKKTEICQSVKKAAAGLSAVLGYHA